MLARTITRLRKRAPSDSAEFPLPNMKRRGTLALLMDVKTIGIFGGIAFLFNNMTGTALSQTASLFQQSGWFPVIFLLLTFTAISTLSSLFIVEAMQTIPGNQHFQGTVEFATMINFYFGSRAHCLGQFCLYGSLMSQAISSIVMASQTVDNFAVDFFGKTCGIAISLSNLNIKCVQSKSDSGFSPFNESYMLITIGSVVVLVLGLPGSFFSFKENINIQIASFILTLTIFSYWIFTAVTHGLDPSLVPAVQHPQSIPNAISIVMLNYPFISTVPSWINLKRNTVNAQHTLWISTMIATSSYILIGLIPGLAFNVPRDSTLISVFENMGHLGDVISGHLFSLIILLPSIPMFFVISNANLSQNFEFDSRFLILFTHILPWLVAIPISTGRLLTKFNMFSSLVFVATANFIIPLIIYIRSCEFRKKYNSSRELTMKQLKLLKLIHWQSKSINTFIDNYAIIKRMINESRNTAINQASSETVEAPEICVEMPTVNSTPAATPYEITAHTFISPVRLLKGNSVAFDHQPPQIIEELHTSTDTLNNTSIEKLKVEPTSQEVLDTARLDALPPGPCSCDTERRSSSSLRLTDLWNKKGSQSSVQLSPPFPNTAPHSNRLSVGASACEMHKQGSKGSFTTIDSFGNRKLTAKTQVPDTIFKSNSERAADDLSILASIEPFLLEDVPNPGRKDSANSYLRDANAPTSPKQNRIHTLPQAGPKIKLSSLKDGSDPDLNAPPLARKLTQPKCSSMINLHPEQHKFNSSSNLNLKRSSTGIRKLSNSNNKQITTNSKTAHFLGSDLDITPASIAESRSNSFSAISATAKSVSFATGLKFTPEGNLPEETESVTESSSDDYTPPVERGSDLRRKSEVSVASFFRNPLARWRRQATSPQPTFPIQEEFISPPFMAVPPWIPADGKTVATGCLVVTCLASFIGCCYAIYDALN